MTSPQLKAMRAEKAYTQKEMATFLGVSLSSLTKWEGGAPIPSWVDEKLGRATAQIQIENLTPSEIQTFSKAAAARGLTGDQLAAELIRHWLRLPLVALLCAAIYQACA